MKLHHKACLLVIGKSIRCSSVMYENQLDNGDIEALSQFPLSFTGGRHRISVVKILIGNTERDQWSAPTSLLS